MSLILDIFIYLAVLNEYTASLAKVNLLTHADSQCLCLTSQWQEGLQVPFC